MKARKEATERDAKVATLPGMTEGMFTRTMSVDYELTQRRQNAVDNVLD